MYKPLLKIDITMSNVTWYKERGVVFQRLIIGSKEVTRDRRLYNATYSSLYRLQRILNGWWKPKEAREYDTSGEFRRHYGGGDLYGYSVTVTYIIRDLEL